VRVTRHSDQKGRNGTWRVLAELSVPSEPGNERLAMERVAEVVKELGLSERRLERLKTAEAEATMNAMEHGNRYRTRLPIRRCRRTWRPSWKSCRRPEAGVCS
jgi:anti-sigma regulatory factor (Ser/Thr protein kinase)